MKDLKEPNWEEIAKMQKPADNKCAHAGCWSEGEMVGFAKCMIQKVKPLESRIFHTERLRIEDGMSAINEANQLREENTNLKALKAELVEGLKSIRGIEAFISDSKMKKHFQSKVYPLITKAETK